MFHKKVIWLIFDAHPLINEIVWCRRSISLPKDPGSLIYSSSIGLTVHVHGYEGHLLCYNWWECVFPNCFGLFASILKSLGFSIRRKYPLSLFVSPATPPWFPNMLVNIHELRVVSCASPQWVSSSKPFPPCGSIFHLLITEVLLLLKMTPYLI